MESLVQPAVWLALILVVLAIAAVVLFGLKSLTYGKISPIGAGTILLPIVLFIVLGFIMPSWVHSAMWTTVIMAVLGTVALIVTGAKGIFTS